MTKRFIVFPNNIVWDNQLDEVVCRCILEGIGDAENVCQRLNEQQSTIEQLQEENRELKHWKKRIIEYLSDWFNKTEYLSVLYKINEIRSEIGLDSDE